MLMAMVHELNIGKGQDIKSAIEAFVLEKKWENVYISGAIGSVIDTKFTTPVDDSFPPKVSVVGTGNQPGEMLSFTGEIMARERMDPALKEIYKGDGPLFIHIHASVAVAGSHVYGGGLSSGKAFRALKVYLQPIDG